MENLNKKANDTLGQLENQIDVLSKLIDAGIDTQINQERLKNIDLLYRAGQIIDELNRSVPNGSRN